MAANNEGSEDVVFGKESVYYSKKMLSKAEIKMPHCSVRHISNAKLINKYIQDHRLSKGACCQLDLYLCQSDSCLVKDRIQNKCNNYLQISKKTSIQKSKTNYTNSEEKYSCDVQCKDYNCSKHYQDDVFCKAHSFRKETNLPYKPSYSSLRRIRNDILYISNCLFELQTVCNYLLVIFIMCQLSNLGIINCVSCQESHSFSYKQSKYQYPPYAPPSNLYNSKRFPASSRSDRKFRERNANGIHHFAGPNTLPLYEPLHANVTHFSEGMLTCIVIYTINLIIDYSDR